MSPRQSPLSATHDAAGAKTTTFGGWEMPVEFDSIRTEHEAVRERVGKFDVSHMGEVTVSGPDARRLMQRLTTNDVTELDPGEAHYSMICDEGGLILDDTIVYDLAEGATEDYLFIPNAGHDEEMAARWRTHADRWGLNATVANRTEAYAMVAVQGPDALATAQDHVDADLDEFSRFDVGRATVAGAEDCYVAATGYTGEEGVEVLAPWDDAETVWDALECQPCGLGARDTLRVEMGFLLSGQEFDPAEEPRTPYEAGVGFTVKLDTEFVGRDRLEQVYEEGPEEKLVGLTLIDRGIPRHGYEITTKEGDAIGHVTSGTMSPTLGEPIALGYVPTEIAEPETTVRVVVRDEPKKARITTPPFLS